MQVDESYRKGSDLVKKYFLQLTQGCGRKGCPNQHCLNCTDGPGLLEPTKAALLSLELARSTDHHLCEDQPPFLSLELLNDLVVAAHNSDDVKLVMKEVAAVFSNSDALNRSFLLSRAEQEAEAKALSMTVADLSGLDTHAIIEMYLKLLQLQSNEAPPAPTHRPTARSLETLPIPTRACARTRRARHWRHRLFADQTPLLAPTPVL